MMRYSLIAGVLTMAFAAAPAAAQQSSAPPEQQTTTRAQVQALTDSIRADASPELQRSLDELAATLDRLGRRIATDPELRASATRAAQSFVGVAQLLVVQQADLLQEALKVASERLAEVGK